MKYDYQDKSVIVTGGAKGIGYEVVKGIVEGGGKVALLDIMMMQQPRLQKNLAIK